MFNIFNLISFCYEIINYLNPAIGSILLFISTFCALFLKYYTPLFLKIVGFFFYNVPLYLYYYFIIFKVLIKVFYLFLSCPHFFFFVTLRQGLFGFYYCFKLIFFITLIYGCVISGIILCTFYFLYRSWIERKRFWVRPPLFFKYLISKYKIVLYFTTLYSNFINLLLIKFGSYLEFYLMGCSSLYDYCFEGVENYIEAAPSFIDGYNTFFITTFLESLTSIFNTYIVYISVHFIQYPNLQLFCCGLVALIYTFYLFLQFVFQVMYSFLVSLCLVTPIGLFFFVPFEYLISKAFFQHVDPKCKLIGYEIASNMINEYISFCYSFFLDIKSLSFFNRSFFIKYFNLYFNFFKLVKNEKRKYFSIVEFLPSAYQLVTYMLIASSVPVFLLYIFIYMHLTNLFFLIVSFILQFLFLYYFSKIYFLFNFYNLDEFSSYKQYITFLVDDFAKKKKTINFLFSFTKSESEILESLNINELYVYPAKNIIIPESEANYNRIFNEPLFSKAFFKAIYAYILSLFKESFLLIFSDIYYVYALTSVKISICTDLFFDYYFNAGHPNSFILTDFFYFTGPLDEFRAEFLKYIDDFHYNIYLKHKDYEKTIEKTYYFRKNLQRIDSDDSFYILKICLYIFTSCVWVFTLLSPGELKTRRFEARVVEVNKEYRQWLQEIRNLYPNFKEFHLNLRKHIIERRSEIYKKITINNLLERGIFYVTDCVEQKCFFEFHSLLFRLEHVLNELLYFDGFPPKKKEAFPIAKVDSYTILKQRSEENNFYEFYDSLNENNNRCEIFLHYALETMLYEDGFDEFDYTQKVSVVPYSYEKRFFSSFLRSNFNTVLFPEFNYKKTNGFFNLYRRCRRVILYVSKETHKFINSISNLNNFKSVYNYLNETFSYKTFLNFFKTLYLLFQESLILKKNPAAEKHRDIYDFFTAMREISTPYPDSIYLNDNFIFKLICLKRGTFLFIEYTYWNLFFIEFYKYYEKEYELNLEKKKKWKALKSKDFWYKKINAILSAFKQKQSFTMRPNPVLINDILEYIKTQKEKDFAVKQSTEIYQQFDIIENDKNNFFLDSDTEIYLKEYYSMMHQSLHRQMIYDYKKKKYIYPYYFYFSFFEKF